jgi:uncharacterized lipoprotein YajG
MTASALTKSLSKRSNRAVALASVAGVMLLAGVAGATASAAAKPKTIACHGGSSSCAATISLTGGASNKKFRITLTDTDLKLVSVVAKPNSVKGAYSLSKRSYSMGGSVFNVTLNAVQSIGKGATLTLKFAVPKK